MAKVYTTHLAMYLGRKEENDRSTRLDNVTCFFTREKYSHIELVYDYSPVTNVGLTWSSSPRDGGVRPTRIEFDPRRWELYRVPTIYSEDDIIEWFNARSGAKYDWFGAVGVVLPFIGQEPTKWFCSEAVGACLSIPRSDIKTPGKILSYYGKDAIRII